MDDLLRLLRKANVSVTRTDITSVVEESDKQRFKLSDDQKRIRANQGHSIPIDLGLEPLAPPTVLYHGTAARFVASIMQYGLQKQSRQHVHLSLDVETATKVGQRHGRPVILAVAAMAMVEAGHSFYRSENGVWLTDHVPPVYLSTHSSK